MHGLMCVVFNTHTHIHTHTLTLNRTLFRLSLYTHSIFTACWPSTASNFTALPPSISDVWEATRKWGGVLYITRICSFVLNSAHSTTGTVGNSPTPPPPNALVDLEADRKKA